MEFYCCESQPQSTFPCAETEHSVFEEGWPTLLSAGMQLRLELVQSSDRLSRHFSL